MSKIIFHFRIIIEFDLRKLNTHMYIILWLHFCSFFVPFNSRSRGTLRFTNQYQFVSQSEIFFFLFTMLLITWTFARNAIQSRYERSAIMNFIDLVTLKSSTYSPYYPQELYEWVRIPPPLIIDRTCQNMSIQTCANCRLLFPFPFPPLRPPLLSNRGTHTRRINNREYSIPRAIDHEDEILPTISQVSEVHSPLLTSSSSEVGLWSLEKKMNTGTQQDISSMKFDTGYQKGIEVVEGKYRIIEKRHYTVG